MVLWHGYKQKKQRDFDFKLLIMDITNPAPHTVLYPGVDRFKCGNCQKWISTSEEIERLKKQLDNTEDKKRYAELSNQLRIERHQSEHCIKVDN